MQLNKKFQKTIELLPISFVMGLLLLGVKPQIINEGHLFFPGYQSCTVLFGMQNICDISACPFLANSIISRNSICDISTGTRPSGDYNIVALTPEQKKVLRYKEQDRTRKKNH